MLKALEAFGKTALALVAAVLLWRPGRRRRALTGTKRIALVRVDDRVGEALLITPLVEALAHDHDVEVVVHQRCVRVLEGHPKIRRVHGLVRTRLFLGAWAPGIAKLRAEKFDAVVNCSNWEVASVTGALVSRLIGAQGPVIGPAVGIGRLLMDFPVSVKPGTTSEVEQRLHLLEPLLGPIALAPPSFRTPQVSAAVEPLVWRAREQPHAVVNPGGRLSWRRVPPEVFSAACRALMARGRTPIVTWGPGEEALARTVVAQAPGAELAPATSLDDLAALMAASGLTLCNNTGPMHLSVAVGARTIACFLNMPPERWGYRTAPHRIIELSDADSDATMIEKVCAALEVT